MIGAMAELKKWGDLDGLFTSKVCWNLIQFMSCFDSFNWFINSV